MSNWTYIRQCITKQRQNGTPSEQALWKLLRNRKLGGFKFRRQHPIVYDQTSGGLKFFILDFYCASARLAVELDGKIHDHQKEKDQARDAILFERGIRTLRIKNDEMADPEKVKSKILILVEYLSQKDE